MRVLGLRPFDVQLIGTFYTNSDGPGVLLQGGGVFCQPKKAFLPLNGIITPNSIGAPHKL